MTNEEQILGLLVKLMGDVQQIKFSLKRLEGKANIMALDLTALQTEVANNTTVEASAITLIQGFATALQAAGTDPVALAALVTTLQTNDAGLAAAVAANTVAAPTASAAAKTLTK
jgi:hypothetical protein